MRRKLPPLNAVRTFEAVARNNSFRRAADELFVTEPAVSRSIKVLEDHFQTKLFERFPKGPELTVEGKALLSSVTRALDDIAIGSDQLYRASKRHSLSLFVTPHISARWLVPKLDGFLNQMPEVDLDIRHSAHIDDIDSRQFDAAIWWSKSNPEHYHNEPLFSLRFVPACSPKLLRQMGGKAAVGILEHATLLHEYDYDNWNDWLRIHNLSLRPGKRGIVFDSYESMLFATISGLGISLLLYPPLTDHLDNEKLVLPFDTELGVDVTFYLIYPSDQPLSEEAQAFVDYIRAFSET